jgi:hypothetical protein
LRIERIIAIFIDRLYVRALLDGCPDDPRVFKLLSAKLTVVVVYPAGSKI